MISQEDLTRFLQGQFEQTDDANYDDEEGDDDGEGSFAWKLFYLLFSMLWMCAICQLARMFNAHDRQEQEEAAEAAEHGYIDQIQKNEKRRATLQSLFVQRKVIRVSRKGNLLSSSVIITDQKERCLTWLLVIC
jgi:hypothetical protein